MTGLPCEHKVASGGGLSDCGAPATRYWRIKDSSRWVLDEAWGRAFLAFCGAHSTTVDDPRSLYREITPGEYAVRSVMES